MFKGLKLVPKQAKNPPKDQPPQAVKNKSLFVMVSTLAGNAESNVIGERIVDMYHFGTRNWLQKHTWWAMHNGHIVDVTVASAEEVAAHIEAQKQALAAKFNADKAHAA